MGASKVPIYAYVDESGNTGKNIFDAAQPNYFTAALVTKGSFDARYTDEVRKIASKVGAAAIHANELGLGRLESIAGDLVELLINSDAHFFICRVEKRYLLASKMFDVLFDSGENAAIAWHNYNLRPSRIILAIKLGHVIDDPIARQFWDCLLMPRERDARAALPPLCEAIKSRLHVLPDQRSREIFTQGLDWIAKHPECVQFATEQRIAKKGHFPNLVGFSNLVKGLDHFSALWKKKIACITHDEQTEFGKMLHSWHELFSNAAPDELEWAGERYKLQVAPGSRFEMKRDDESAGIQMADVVLWLLGQALKDKQIPRYCSMILALVLERSWYNDFSFGGVEKQLLEKYGDILFGPMEEEIIDRGRRFVEMAEARRQVSMEQYEADGLPPFARPVTVAENADTPEIRGP